MKGQSPPWQILTLMIFIWGVHVRAPPKKFPSPQNLASIWGDPLRKKKKTTFPLRIRLDHHWSTALKQTKVNNKANYSCSYKNSFTAFPRKWFPYLYIEENLLYKKVKQALLPNFAKMFLTTVCKHQHIQLCNIQ